MVRPALKLGTGSEWLLSPGCVANFAQFPEKESRWRPWIQHEHKTIWRTKIYVFRFAQIELTYICMKKLPGHRLLHDNTALLVRDLFDRNCSHIVDGAGAVMEMWIDFSIGKHQQNTQRGCMDAGIFRLCTCDIERVTSFMRYTFMPQWYCTGAETMATSATPNSESSLGSSLDPLRFEFCWTVATPCLTRIRWYLTT